MSVALFDGDELSTESYVTFRGSSQPHIIIYPRTIGGIIQESGIVEKSLKLHSYLVPPANSSREDIENFFHEMNERIGIKEATLTCNGNDYLKANVKSIDYDRIITDGFLKHTIDFELSDQNSESSVIRQLATPDLVNFSRGRKMAFTTIMEDGSERTFNFWHNVDVVKPFETDVSIKVSTNQLGTTGKVIRVGGFERNVCMCWIIGPDNDTRKNLEGYFYNIINGPLGRLGTLVIDGTQTINKALLTEFSMDEGPLASLHYEVTFLSSLQC
jgi:hypothetical protein